MKSEAVILPELARVGRTLEIWRKGRKFRQPIPEPLWSEIVALARVHGVSAVSRALRLDYYTLQGRVREISQAPSASVPAEFVEVKLPSSEGSAACVAQLEDGQGRKLTVRWESFSRGELLAIVQAFWQQSA
jgi:hypothetical protein